MKRTALLMSCIAVIALVFAGPLPVHASDGTPVDVSVSLPGGATNSAVVSYDAGIMAPANSALRPLAVSWICTGLSATNTITLGKAAGGAAWKSVITTGAGSAKGVSLVTDEWYWLRGGDIVVSASVTNAMTIVIHSLEK